MFEFVVGSLCYVVMPSKQFGGGLYQSKGDGQASEKSDKRNE
jgi:hypothetical protein